MLKAFANFSPGLLFRGSRVSVGWGQYRNAVASGRRHTSLTEELLSYDRPDATALRY